LKSTAGGGAELLGLAVIGHPAAGVNTNEGGGTTGARIGSAGGAPLRVVRLSAMRNSSRRVNASCAVGSSTTAGGASAGRGSSKFDGVVAGTDSRVVLRRSPLGGGTITVDAGAVELVGAGGGRMLGGETLLVGGGLCLGGAATFGLAAGEAGLEGGAAGNVEPGASVGGVKTLELLGGRTAGAPGGAEKNSDGAGRGAAGATVGARTLPARASSALISRS